jgi:hypothetical protein
LLGLLEVAEAVARQLSTRSQGLMLFLVRLRVLKTGAAVLGVSECLLVFCGEMYDQMVSDTRLKKGIIMIEPSRQMQGGLRCETGETGYQDCDRGQV